MIMCAFSRTTRMHCLRAHLSMNNNKTNNNNNDLMRLRQDRADALPQGKAYSYITIITIIILVACPFGLAPMQAIYMNVANHVAKQVRVAKHLILST